MITVNFLHVSATFCDHLQGRVFLKDTYITMTAKVYCLCNIILENILP